MNRLAIILLIGSIFLAVGGWMQTLDTWADFSKPGSVAGLFLILGGCLINWLNESPLKITASGGPTNTSSSTTSTTTTTQDGKA